MRWPSWSSLIEGDKGCIGPNGKLLCLCQAPQNNTAHAWQHSIHVGRWGIYRVVHLLLLKSSMA